MWRFKTYVNVKMKLLYLFPEIQLCLMFISTTIEVKGGAVAPDI